MTKTLAIFIGVLMCGVSMAQFFIAHRGANHIAPENTIEAFKAAFESGAKFVEGDFWITNAGKIICIHDRGELKALSGIDKAIPDLTSEDLSNADLANNDRWREKYKNIRIPSIDDVFNCIPKDGTLVFELKNYGPDFAKKFEAARRNAGLKKEQIIVISFNADILADIYKNAKVGEASWIYWLENRDGVLHPSPEAAIETCKRIGAKSVDVGNIGEITKEYVDAIKAAGLKFYIWTVNSEADVKKSVGLGVDAINTDKIVEMQNYFERLKAETL